MALTIEHIMSLDLYVALMNFTTKAVPNLMSNKVTNILNIFLV